MAKLYLKMVQLVENIARINKLLDSNNIDLNLVTKFCLSRNDILTPVLEKGLTKGISDSNVVNFTQLPKELYKKYNRSLIKTRISDIKALPSIEEYARPTRLFVSDRALLNSIKDLIDNDTSGLTKDECPEIVLIIENGDRKEGFFPEDIPSVLDDFSSLNIKGISTNFSCLSGVLPTAEDIIKLGELANLVSSKINKPPFLSVGGTVVYDLLKAGKLKGYVQEVRMGEGIFFGYDSSSGKAIPELFTDNFLLEGEILEICKKEILPISSNAVSADSNEKESQHTGFTATGDTIDFPVITGLRKRAVLDFGVLVSNFKNLRAVDSDITFAGQTFDFSVVDITESSSCYATGMYIAFKTDYGAVSQAMINPFVDLYIEK